MSRFHARSSSSKRRTEPTTKYKRHLKNCLFNKHGWREEVITEDGPKKVWFAYCAFGCGTILWMEIATLDHYPIPQRLGGEWVLHNLRLACYPCNSAFHDTPGSLSLFMPVGLSAKERTEWFLNHEKESKEMNSIHGIPLEKL